MKNYRHRRSGKRPKNDSGNFFAETEAQQTNQAAQGAFFQPKMEIDPVNSPAEKEADAAANQVVNHATGRDSNTQTVRRKKIQRMGQEEEPAAKRIQRKGEEEEPAAKRIQRKGEEEEPAAKRIQRKGEEEEPAAKRIQRKGEEEEPAAKRIQRKGEEEEPAAKRIQRKGRDEEPPTSLEDKIKKNKGGGRPLPEALRAEMEKEFAADFSRVRIHTGPEAVEMTQALYAHAFTHGYDIYFNAGRFDPASKSGKELLAHELAHVVQQKGT